MSTCVAKWKAFMIFLQLKKSSLVDEVA